MMKKKKQSRSQSSTKKTLEPSSSDSSPSPRLLSIFRSKLGSGKDLKHMFQGKRNKPIPGLSSQSRIVRCPKCRTLLQEPLDATSYKCGGCDSILYAKRGDELEGNNNSIPLALLSSENRSFRTEDEFAGGGSKSPMRKTNREYNSRASPSVERGYHSETVYKHETSDIRREWMRRADEFSVTGDSDAFNSARSSPYNSRSNASEWTQREGRYGDLPPRVPFYPASPSPSSTYEYGYSSPFHGSQVSASQQSYYQQQQANQFKQYGREGSFQQSSSLASPIHDGKYYHWSSQSQLQYHNNNYESNSSATQHRSVYSERSYKAAEAPHHSTYSERSLGISKSGTSSEKSSKRDKNRYARERNPVVKRHILPSAGGAPFATCSYCLELLQLPQVPPHGKQKRYQVRCGSCSGVLKFSTRDKADTVFYSPIKGFVDETVTIHQDSASEGHEEMYPDESHLSCSDNDSGDAICKSMDAVSLGRSLETFEDMRNVSSEFLDSKLEALQPQLKPLVNHKSNEQQPSLSGTIKDTSRIDLQETHSKNLTEMDKKICDTAGYDLEESGYEKNEILKPEEIVEDVHVEYLEVTLYKNGRLRELSEEAERVAERTVSHSEESLNKNQYVSETHIPSENTRDTHEFHWEVTQENEVYGAESTWEEIMGDKPELHMENSRNSGGSICDSISSSGETFEDTPVEEDKEHISNTFSDVISATPQSLPKSLENEIHEKQSKDGKSEQSQYEYEKLNERKELDKTFSRRVRYEFEESCYEINETLEPNKAGKDGSVVSLQKARETYGTTIEGDTGEASSVHQMDSQNKNVENSHGTLEPFYLEGSRYASERIWEEAMGVRAGLHLEEYESSYENHSKPFDWSSERPPTFHMHESVLGTILEPEDDVDARPESSLRGSFNGHESSEERVMFHESQDTKPEQSQYEYENSSEIQELGNTVFNIVTLELQEGRHEKNETLEPSKMVGDGSVVSQKEVGEPGEENSVYHLTESQNENMENSYSAVEAINLEGRGYASEKTWEQTMGDGAGLQLEEFKRNPFEWNSERAPTFCQHEYELGTMQEPEEDANARSISSSRDFFNNQESLKERIVSHEEEPWLGDENKTEALIVGVMVEDGPLFHLEKCENESTTSEETFERTSERAPTFYLHKYEQGTMLEADKDADEISESNSSGSDDNHESSKVRAVFEEEPQLVNDSRTEAVQVSKIEKHEVLLHLEKEENGSMRLEETFEWTSERAPTFRLHEYELGTMLEIDKDVDRRSEASLRDSFNDHGIFKVQEMNHEEDPGLVIDSRNESVQVDKMARDMVSLQLEECENESMKLDETFEWNSGRNLTFRRHGYELGTILEPDEDADLKSESSSRGFFNDHVSSKERAVIHEDEPGLVDDYETKTVKVGVMMEDGPLLHLEKLENEKMELDETFEARDDIFRLTNTVEQERTTFHLESQDKQESLRHAFKQGEGEEELPGIGSRESPSKMAEIDSESDEEILGERSEKSGLTFEPYARIYSTTEASEMVGLRHALYETQSSPLRSPLTSPIHTPVGSPLHYLMGSRIRSPIASAMHSHIVSPMRSPINSTGSLSDVLFFGKKA